MAERRSRGVSSTNTRADSTARNSSDCSRATPPTPITTSRAAWISRRSPPRPGTSAGPHTPACFFSRLPCACHRRAACCTASPWSRPCSACSICSTDSAPCACFLFPFTLNLYLPQWVEGTSWMILAFLAIHLLVLMEVADRLSLKSDLEIARDIQIAMLPRGAQQSGRRARVWLHSPGQHRGRRFLRHPAARRRTPDGGRGRRGRQRQSRRAADGAVAGDVAHAGGRRAGVCPPHRAAERADLPAQPGVAVHHVLLRALRSRPTGRWNT